MYYVNYMYTTIYNLYITGEGNTALYKGTKFENNQSFKLFPFNDCQMKEDPTKRLSFTK